METIFATQEYDGDALFALYDLTEGIWTFISPATTTWSDVGDD